MNKFNNEKIIIIVSIIFLSLSAFATWADDKNQKGVDQVKQLRWLYRADPEKDALEAIAKGDMRLRAIYGYTIIIPGIKDDYTKYKKAYGIKPIEGTSDFLQNEEHGKLNTIAVKYAEKYNQVILQIKKSWVKISQIRTLSTERLGAKIGRISAEELGQVIEGMIETVGA